MDKFLRRSEEAEPEKPAENESEVANKKGKQNLTHTKKTHTHTHKHTSLRNV